MNLRYFTSTVLVCFAFAQPVSAVENGSAVADVSINQSGINFTPVNSNKLSLTVKGPDDIWFRDNYAQGKSPSLGLYHKDGGLLPDGNYTFELRTIPAEVGEQDASDWESKVQTGRFIINSGSIVVQAELSEPDLQQ